MIVAIDFDGTLCTPSCFPKIGEPNTPLIEWCKAQRAAGTSLVLWTCRVDYEDGRDYLTRAVNWCRDHGLEFDAINDNLPRIKERFGANCRKIVADLYIDDNAINPVELPFAKKEDT